MLNRRCTRFDWAAAVSLHAVGMLAVSAVAQPRITTWDRAGRLVLTGVFTNGVVVVEQASRLSGPWRPVRNQFTTAKQAEVTAEPSGETTFVRVQALDLTPSQGGFTNLIHAYGLLSTIAGAGGTAEDVNKWRPEFEGRPATEVELSRPHIAMADAAGNIYIADKSAHAVRMVRPDGRLVTVAGINVPGDGPDALTPATESALNQPNGLWVRADGTVYILDLQNGKIRKRTPDGQMQTLFAVPGGIPIGRGLWVRDDETLAYVACGTVVKRWTPAEGVSDYASGFVQLANLAMDPQGRLAVTDRFGHRVVRIESDGTVTPLAGSGWPGDPVEGQLAVEAPLNQPRAIWFLPSGAFFVGTHRGSRVWYVDVDGRIHLFLNGHTSDTHAGDGTWFYNPAEFRVSEVRAITMDYEGNLLITEHDAGYVRRVRFLPYVP